MIYYYLYKFKIIILNFTLCTPYSVTSACVSGLAIVTYFANSHLVEYRFESDYTTKREVGDAAGYMPTLAIPKLSLVNFTFGATNLS